MAKSKAQNRKLQKIRRERPPGPEGTPIHAGEAAEKCSLNPRTIQKIEQGDINILLTTVARIQAAQGCSWGEILGPEVKRRAR